MSQNADLIDVMEQASTSKQREQHKQAISGVRSIVSNLSNDEKLTVFRDLMLQQIYKLIDKFPEQTQKEMLAIMTNEYLERWN